MAVVVGGGGVLACVVLCIKYTVSRLICCGLFVLMVLVSNSFVLRNCLLAYFIIN